MATPRRIDTAAAELRVVIAQLLRRLRAEYDFPIAYATVLSRLEREGPQTTSGLAAAERMRPQSMAQTVRDLEEGGLVVRSPDAADKRRQLVAITAAGRKRLATERQRRENWLADAIRRDLSADEQRTLIAAVPLLRRLSERRDR